MNRQRLVIQMSRMLPFARDEIAFIVGKLGARPRNNPGYRDVVDALLDLPEPERERVYAAAGGVREVRLERSLHNDPH